MQLDFREEDGFQFGLAPCFLKICITCMQFTQNLLLLYSLFTRLLNELDLGLSTAV
jgi:hypothetical protein